jgi:orotidine-5'-phosphate decarboxylase
MSAQQEGRIIVALDYPSLDQALDLADRLDPMQCRVKVGKELFTRSGPAVVEALVSRGFEVFLDLKFHDIPNTVAHACAAAADLGAWMLNVHASGGMAMMRAAREQLDRTSPKALVIAVTVLTSLDDDDLAAIGCPGSAQERVASLASLAMQAGLDGVVCSPREVDVLRARLGRSPVLVTPGIRPLGTASADQKRTMTPEQAVAAGADYLVIGRPITGAPDPMAALTGIQAALAAALSGTR